MILTLFSLEILIFLLESHGIYGVKGALSSCRRLIDRNLENYTEKNTVPTGCTTAPPEILNKYSSILTILRNKKFFKPLKNYSLAMQNFRIVICRTIFIVLKGFSNTTTCLRFYKKTFIEIKGYIHMNIHFIYSISKYIFIERD